MTCKVSGPIGFSFVVVGLFEEKDFVTKPNTIPKLKNCIRNEVYSRPMSVIHRVMANVVKRSKRRPVWKSEEDA